MKRHHRSLMEIERKAKEIEMQNNWVILQRIYVALDFKDFSKAEQLLAMTGFDSIEDLEFAVEGCVEGE